MNDMGMGQMGGGAGPGGVDPQDASTNKVMALLSYFGIFLVIPYLMAKQSPFVRYHLNQGIILLLVGVACSIAQTVLGFVFNMLGSIGGILSMVTSLGVLVVMLGLFVMGAMNAWNGRAKPLPVVGGMLTILK